MPTLSPADLSVLSDSLQDLFSSLVDLFIDLAPVLVLVTAGWVCLTWLTNLVKAKQESNYEKEDFDYLASHPNSHLSFSDNSDSNYLKSHPHSHLRYKKRYYKRSYKKRRYRY